MRGNPRGVPLIFIGCSRYRGQRQPLLQCGSPKLRIYAPGFPLRWAHSFPSLLMSANIFLPYPANQSFSFCGLSKVSKVSAFMYGHDDTNIIYADALDEIKELRDGTFSVLVANPPYSVSGFLETLSEKQRKRYSIFNDDINVDKNNAIETFFIERAAQLLKSGGVAGIVLPVSVLTKDGIYSRAREVILKSFDLISLVKFDKGTFGKTSTNTVVLFLRRKEINTSEWKIGSADGLNPILFIKIPIYSRPIAVIWDTMWMTTCTF